MNSENTRLPINFVDILIKKHSQQVRQKIFEAYESSDVIKLLKELKELDEKREQENMELTTPVIRGYKLIKEPQPVPGKIDNEVPIFTWGEVDSTPNIIPSQNSSVNRRFSVQQTPIREDIAHNLSYRFQSKKKDQKT